MQQYADICLSYEQFASLCQQRNVTLVLASKTIPQEVLQQLDSRYHPIFGENRVQELCDKYFDAHWLFIGRLQRNKVKYLVDKVQMICSVDSLALVQEIEKRCATLEKVMPILVEVNAGEANKGGVPFDEAETLLGQCADYAHVQVQGLMCVLPRQNAAASAAAVQQLYNRLQATFDLRYLSMGMSEDYDVALQYGANMIRIGSAIFGKRS